jgi:putative tricarboxylic transport membrane protein
MLAHLLAATQAILAPAVFLYLLLGIVLGIIVGALPGLTATMAMIVLLPITFGLPVLESIQLLMGVFVGGITAGSLTAIAIGIPGTPASAATVLDGYQLTLAGRAGEAISTMFLLDLIGGLLGAIVCIFVAPQLASFALRFGPPEYALLALIGMSLVVSLSSRSLLKGLVSGVLGIGVATIGVDPMTGYARFALGSTSLEAGIGYGAVMIGLFGLTEVLIGLNQAPRAVQRSADSGKRLAWLPHAATAFRHVIALRWTILRSAPIGILIGALPGLGSDIAAWLGYDAAKRFARRPQDFGRGSLEGLAGCEVAKSSEDGGAIIPTVTFGIPGDSQTVVILGALMLHGLRPGPLLFTEHSEIVWSVFAALIVAPFITCALGLLAVRPTVWLVSRPSHLLYPAVILFCVIGAFAYSNSMFDVWMMLLFGAIGVGMRLLDYPVVPFVLTYILTPLMEAEFRRGLALVQDNAWAFFERPLFVGLLVVGILAFLGASNVFSRTQSRLVEQE